MKTIEIIFLNGETQIKRSIETKAELNLSKVVGTVCSDLFRLIDLQKKTGTKLFSLNKPFEMLVKTDEITVDTTKIKSEYKTRFKLNGTAKRKKSFAQTVFTVVEFATTKTKVTTIESLENSLNSQILTEELGV